MITTTLKTALLEKYTHINKGVIICSTSTDNASYVDSGCDPVLTERARCDIERFPFGTARPAAQFVEGTPGSVG